MVIGSARPDSDDEAHKLNAVRRGTAYIGRDMATHPLEGNLLESLPSADSIPFRKLASRHDGRSTDGPKTRPVLPGLLLGVNGLVFLWRHNEFTSVNRAGRFHPDRKSNACEYPFLEILWDITHRLGSAPVLLGPVNTIHTAATEAILVRDKAPRTPCTCGT